MYSNAYVHSLFAFNNSTKIIKETKQPFIFSLSFLQSKRTFIAIALTWEIKNILKFCMHCIYKLSFIVEMFYIEVLRN